MFSDETIDGFEHVYISEVMNQKHSDGLSGYFYLCSPPTMKNEVEKDLVSLGISECKIIEVALLKPFINNLLFY
ncbi:MAG: flavodoxin reductase [Bacteroidetes bacterium OLB11]|nr:MAG: flavodoxin reductase [Bacteroidetes bacterium OLB11]